MPLAPLPRLARYTAISLLISALIWPLALPIDENLTKGATNNHIFEAGAWGENIDTLNGGLNLTIPIGPEYNVAADVSYQLKLTYSSKFWHLDDLNDDGRWRDRHRPRLSGRGQAGLGFMLQMGRYYNHVDRAVCVGNSALDPSVFEDATGAAHPDGQSYEMRPGLRSMFADGSFIKNLGGSGFDAPDGTRYLYGPAVQDLRTEDAIPNASDPLWPKCPSDPNGAPFDHDTNEYRGSYVTAIMGQDRRPGVAPMDPNSAYNWVKIEYETNPGMKHLMRRITNYRNGVPDPRTVEFVNSMEDPTNPGTNLPMGSMGYVQSVSVPVFSSDPAVVRRATYTFHYTVDDIFDPYADPNVDTDFNAFDNGPDQKFEDVLLLIGITFPEGYTMGFEYTPSEWEGRNVGYLQARVLPTGARVEYDYEQYRVSAWKAVAIPGVPVFTDLNIGGSTEGISAKRVVITNPSGPPDVFTWSYQRSEFATGFPNPHKVIVTDPLGNATVTHFHANIGDICPAVGVCHNFYWNNGLAYRTEYYQGSAESGDLIRLEVQIWEDDVYKPDHPWYQHTGEFKRVVERRVIYNDDGGKASRILYKDWDGFGNFRTIEEYGFDAVPYRVQRVDYNCDVREADGSCMKPETYVCRNSTGPDDPIPPYHCPLSQAHLDNWVLGTYTYSQTEDPYGTVLQRSEFAFDPNGGRLLSKQDLLTIPQGTNLALQPGNPASVFSAGDVKTEFLYETDAACPAGGATYKTGNVCQRTVSDYGATSRVFTEKYTYQHGPYLATREVLDPNISWDAENRDVDPATGLTRVSRDPSGIETAFDYDLFGRLTAVTPLGPERQASLSYPDIWTTVLTQSDAVAGEIWSRFKFDKLGRLIMVEKKQADGSIAAQKTKYDIAGRVTWQGEWGDPSVLEGDPAKGTTFDYTDPLSGLTDPFGRVRKTTTADAKVTRAEYAGLSSSVTVEGIQGDLDPNAAVGLINGTTLYDKDAFGRLTKVISPRLLGGSGLRVGADAHYSYDRLDRLTTVRLESEETVGSLASQYRSFGYDALGRQVSATNPENGTLYNLGYDAAGNLLKRQDAAGKVFVYEYDAASRLVKSWLDTPGPDPDILVNTYDQTGASFVNGLGRLTTGTSYDDTGKALQQEEFNYVGLNGRLSQRRFRLAGWNPDPNVEISSQPQLVMGYSYNPLGLLHSITYPDDPNSGRTETSLVNTYSNGYLTRVVDPVRGDLVESLAYNVAGGVRIIRTRGGVETTIQPDVRNRPGSIAVVGPNPTPPGPPVTLFSSGTYAYDGAGNIASIGGPPADTFSYDALNRLVKATIAAEGGYLEQMDWIYDNLGNMKLQRRTTDPPMGADVILENSFSIDPLRNQILNYRTGPQTAPVSDVEYDVNGNLIRDRELDHIFDSRNRLIEVHSKSGDLVARYAYVSGGNRVTKFDAATGTTTFYLRDSSGQVLSEFSRINKPNAVTAWLKDYVYAAGRHVAMAENDTPTIPGGLASTASAAGDEPFVSLTWTQVPDLDLAAYKIVRTPGGGLIPLQEPVPGFYDTNVVAGVAYTYSVKAVDAAGAMSDASASLKVIPGDATAPVVDPNALTAIAGDNSVTLTWLAASAPQGDLLGYRLYRRTTAAPCFSNPTPCSEQQLGGVIRETQITDLTPSNGTTYHYHVRAVDTRGNVSVGSVERSALPTDDTPPMTPQGLYAIPSTQVELFWQIPDPNIPTDLVGYKVYRSAGPINPVNPGTPMASPTGAGYVDVTASPNQTYYYRVSARDDDLNESGLSAELTVVTRESASFLPAPTISSSQAQQWGWSYCGEFADPYSGQCYLWQNVPTYCSPDDPNIPDGQEPIQYVSPPWTHENSRNSVFSWNSVPGAQLERFRIYSRLDPNGPLQLAADLPAPYFEWMSNWAGTPSCQNSGAIYDHYPVAIAEPVSPPEYRYQSHWFNPEEMCRPKRCRVSAVAKVDGYVRESVMSAEVQVPGALAPPENLEVRPEPIATFPYEPGAKCTSSNPTDDKKLDPLFYGLTLSWRASAASCSGNLSGYHVYRSRRATNGLYATPAIRLTREPFGNTAMRVEYLPNPDMAGGPITVYALEAPFGFNDDHEEEGDPRPMTYAVTAVDASGTESAFSNRVRAHTEAQHQTDPNSAEFSPTNCPINSEYTGYTPAFTPPDPNVVVASGLPSALTWQWQYGGAAFDINSVPKARNWALVNWNLSANQTANEYRLLRQGPGEPGFSELDLRMIPGDDGGIRELIWDMPLELACEDANYALKADYVYGHPADPNARVYFPNPILKRKLIPENQRIAVDPNQRVIVSWDLLPTCGGQMSGHTIHRSANSVASCSGSAPTDPNAYVQIGSAPATSTTIPPYTPPTVTSAYWYIVRASWPGGASEIQGGDCGSANGQITWKNPLAPSGPTPENDTWRVAGIQPQAPSDDQHRPGVPIISERGYPLASPHRTIGQSNPAVKLYFYHLDHLGTPRVITDVAGQLVSKHKYLPYGEELSPPPSLNTHEFTGHERDKETGRDYMLARYYSPSLLRFLSSDPLPSGNLYRYVYGNPVRFNDPFGLKPGGNPHAAEDEAVRNKAWGHDPDAAGLGSTFDKLWKNCQLYCIDTTPSRSTDTTPPGLPGDPYNSGSVARNASSSQSNGSGGSPEIIIVEAVMPPSTPDWTNLEDNLLEAYRHKYDLLWFYFQVRAGGPWGHRFASYRQLRNQPYRNFQFGAAGAVVGIPLAHLLQEAGRAQPDRHLHPYWGTPGIPGLPFTGTGGFGDQPGDPYWIEQGYNYGTIWLQWWP